MKFFDRLRMKFFGRLKMKLLFRGDATKTVASC